MSAPGPTARIDPGRLEASVLERPEAPPLRFVESYSGVRGHFGSGPGIGESAKTIVLAYAASYVDELVRRGHLRGAGLRLLVGRDSRPTSAVIATLQAAGFSIAAIQHGVTLELLECGLITAPAIQAAIRYHTLDGGVLVTGSHNALDQNGLKFLTGAFEPEPDSYNDGGAVLDGSKMRPLIARARARLRAVASGSDDLCERANDWLASKQELPVLREFGYIESVRRTLQIDREEGRELRRRCDELGRRLVVDCNGGAGSEIVPALLRRFVSVQALHAEPGTFAHGIEPVGDALLDASRALTDTGAELAVVLDADADRGNLVVARAGDTPDMLGPQQVAALSVLSMLAWVENRVERYLGRSGQTLAVVTHDATSGLVHTVARCFDAECFEVETGEANVVARMRQARADGYTCPVGVEGANGGVILGNARVRDGALTGLLAMISTVDAGTVARLRTRFPALPGSGPMSLLDLLAVLPEWHTLQETLRTDATSVDPATVRADFERRLCAARTPSRSGFRLSGAESIELTSLEVLNYEETRVRRGAGNRESQTGGLKVLLRDGEGREHFVWFRGSKTEAGVTRIVADSPDADVAAVLMTLARRWLEDGPHAASPEGDI